MRMKFVLGLIVLLQTAPVLAYIGPGSGISLLGGLWGVLVAIVLAVGAVLIWPVRYMFRRLRRKRRDAQGTDPAEPADPVETEQSSSRSE
ncbi:hypothetical protein G4Y73_08165 [Wenzhouxiangella sp. XN201]|uniref:hypothetical protein n=1 Tax=Wenzhouxiangella sp. XN201 TaxID=2710755 RepID=UPI0013CCF6C8|nr:hypothetical protein [Wenzhouxiangella sp. XN201]NEZ04125.1 hypothetical protein [Wenzhouxiangella sp. XN201]